MACDTSGTNYSRPEISRSVYHSDYCLICNDQDPHIPKVNFQTACEDFSICKQCLEEILK